MNGRSVAQTDFSGWQPRIGAAYRINDKLVMRGGFSRLDLMPLGVAGLGAGTNTASAVTSITGTVDGITPAVSLDNPFPNGFKTPISDKLGTLTRVGQPLTGGNINNRTPYQWQWNVGFEYALGSKSVLSVGYAGAVSRRIVCPFYTCTDQIPYQDVQSSGARVFDTVPNPFYGIITDPTAALSGPSVQLGQLLKQYSQYTSWTNALANSWQSPITTPLEIIGTRLNSVCEKAFLRDSR